MPIADEETRRLEALADRAWPAAEVLAYDGWELRATGAGIGRRVNSVAPTAAGALPLDEKVTFCEAFYRERGLASTFKLTHATRPAGLEDVLTGMGYRLDAPVSVRTRTLLAAVAPVEVGLAAHPSPGWLAANAAAGSHYRAAPSAFLDLIGRIRAPLAFASIERHGEVAAVGMAVAEEGCVGLFEIGTHPGHRRQGLAREVTGALLAWGREQGAAIAYLQVMLANAPALALYETMGFTEAYRYWYRVAP